MTTPTIALRDSGSWQPPWRHLVLLHVSATADDGLVAVWSAAEDRAVFLGSSDRIPVRPTAATDGGAPALVTLHGGPDDMSVLATIEGLELPRPRAQVLSDGSVLVVADVDDRPSGRAALNAVVVAPNGTVLRHGTLGQGAHLVQASATGEIWAAYGEGRGPTAPAIALFTEDLRFSRVLPAAPDQTRVAALNVVGGAGWALDHALPTLARLESGQSRLWSTSVRGATGILVAGNTIALVGGEGARDRVVVGWLGTAAFEPFLTARLVLPHGDPLPEDAVLVSRGSVLHCIAGDRRYRFDLAGG
jgi:hypothetical protein